MYMKCSNSISLVGLDTCFKKNSCFAIMFSCVSLLYIFAFHRLTMLDRFPYEM